MRYCLRPSRTGCSATILPRSRTRIRSGNCWTSTTRRVRSGNAVVVAPDGDEAVVADAALQLEHGIEAMLGQRLQLGLLGGERLGDDALRCAMGADVGDGVEPIGQLSIEVVKVAEAASEEEVLPDIAERSLNLALNRHDGIGALMFCRRAFVLALW